MAEQEVTLMKGNEAIAHAAIRCGADGYFGYPITPQSEVIETLAELKPWETTGMVVLQAESEVASINMIYGGAAAGKKVLTSSSITWCRADAGGYHLYGWCRTARRVCQRAAWRSRSGYHPAFTGRLFPGYAWWWQWRLQRHCAGSQLGAGDGRLR